MPFGASGYDLGGMRLGFRIPPVCPYCHAKGAVRLETTVAAHVVKLTWWLSTVCRRAGQRATGRHDFRMPPLVPDRPKQLRALQAAVERQSLELERLKRRAEELLNPRDTVAKARPKRRTR